MKPSMELQTKDGCKITVKDTTIYQEENSDAVSKNSFKKSETVTIYVLRYLKDNVETFSNPIVVTHDSNEVYTTIDVKIDGTFDIVQLILPTQEGINRVRGILSSYKKSYYVIINGNNVTITSYEKPGTSVSIVDVVNTENTTAQKFLKTYVSICNLRKCYINLCQQILSDKVFSSCSSKNKLDNDLVYKRDLVWMTINVVKYLTDLDQLDEVDRIIKMINGCNGLCNSSNTKNSSNGCGCGK